jgi:putative addiction module killer protein
VAQVKATRRFSDWLDRLKDLQGRARIQARIERLAAGNPGEHRNLKHGVSELKINVGPGYRVYYARRGEIVIVLLCGGSKSSQTKDIQTAYELVKDVEY